MPSKPEVPGSNPWMRQGEILGLKWQNVDFERSTIYVAHTKTGRPRKLPMSKSVEVELRSLKQDASRDEHVFSCPLGRYSSPPNSRRPASESAHPEVFSKC